LSHINEEEEIKRRNMEPKHKIRASVRLTEEAHQSLLEMAKANKVSMKTMGSEAIHTLDRAPKVSKEMSEHMEQLKFKALRFKQLALVYIILVGISVGLLGFILGVSI